MAKLTEPIKIAIVQALACFDTPSQVVDLVKQEFGLTITRQQVATYDPTKAAGKNLSTNGMTSHQGSRDGAACRVQSVVRRAAAPSGRQNKSASAGAVRVDTEA